MTATQAADVVLEITANFLLLFAIVGPIVLGAGLVLLVRTLYKMIKNNS